MYEALKEILLDIFQAPTAPPEPPAGKHDSVRIFRASPHFLTYQFIFFMLFTLFLAIVFLAIAIMALQNSLTVGLTAAFSLGLLWILILISGYFIIRLEYDMRYYILTDRSLRIRKGVLQILEQTLTFVNIQNIKIEQGPIERSLGISTLVVETAGGGSASNPHQGSATTNYHRASLNGLEDAEAVRDLILNYLKRLPHTSGLGGPEERDHQHLPSQLAYPEFSPQEIQALREILHEVKQLRGFSLI